MHITARGSGLAIQHQSQHFPLDRKLPHALARQEGVRISSVAGARGRSCTHACRRCPATGPDLSQDVRRARPACPATGLHVRCCQEGAQDDGIGSSLLRIGCGRLNAWRDHCVSRAMAPCATPHVAAGDAGASFPLAWIARCLSGAQRRGQAILVAPAGTALVRGGSHCDTDATCRVLPVRCRS